VFEIIPIAVALFITTLVNLTVFIVSWNRRKTKGGLYFSLGMLGITIWTLAAGLGYAAVPLELKILFAKIDAVGYNSALSLFVFFAIYYAGFDEWAEKVWVQALLMLLPASNIFLIVTNELHRWVWIGFLPVGDNVFVFEHGHGFTWIAFVGYLLISALIAILWLASRRGSEVTRRQGRLLLYASLFPIAANLIYLYGVTGMEGVDWSSITFSITGLLFLRALYGTHLLDLAPIARDKLIQNLSDGMIVLDIQNRIIDINQAAANMLQSSSAALIGKNLTDVAPLSRSLLDQPPGQEITTELKSGERYYDLLISPLREKPQKIIGRLIIIRDVTVRKENELRLISLSNELQEVQAQVIEQQRTIAKVEERQRMGRDMHDSVSQSIHSLMMFSETLTAMLKKNNTDKAIEISERIQESGTQALKEIRVLIHETQSLLTDQSAGLLPALEERLNKVERRTGLNVQMICNEDFNTHCPPEWIEGLYYMIVEALNNSLKYARARGVSVTIHCTESQLEVEVKDDGAGFDTSTVGSGGFGMHTMRQRAEIMGGELSVKSTQGQGTCVSFRAKIGAWHGSNKYPDCG
jgi:PAS domain S-box-containing protein